MVRGVGEGERGWNFEHGVGGVAGADWLGIAGAIAVGVFKGVPGSWGGEGRMVGVAWVRVGDTIAHLLFVEFLEWCGERPGLRSGCGGSMSY